MFPHTTEELATAAGVTENTILIWKRLGLFSGIETNLTGGPSMGVKRRWAAEAMSRAKQIKALKSKGFGMEAIFKHFNIDPPPEPAKKRVRKKAKKAK